MTKNELDVLTARMEMATSMYNHAVHTKSTYDSFKGVVRESIVKAGRFDIRPVDCYAVEIPLTDEVKNALDIIEGVLKRQAEEAAKIFEEFKACLK